jgi:hypothetical protein
MGPVEDSLILYRNPETAVEATFEMEDTADAAGEVQPNLRPTGVRFRLRWPRPSFFAREALPILLELAEAMELVVGSADDLIRVWQAGNTESARSHTGAALPYMNPERSDRWWAYQSRKAALHRRLGDNVFVPTLVGAGLEGGTKDLQLHITWTDGIPLVLPECDVVTLLDGNSPSNFKIRGTATYGDVLQGLQPFLESIRVDGLGELQILTPKKARKARSVFLNMPVRATNLWQADPAAWIDVK